MKILMLLLLALSLPSFAGDARPKTAAPQAPAAGAAAQGSKNVLDFEADVIEGEKKRPDIFLQMGSQKQTMDSVIYQRKDFNDFHKVDRYWRPAYIEPKGRTR